MGAKLLVISPISRSTLHTFSLRKGSLVKEHLTEPNRALLEIITFPLATYLLAIEEYNQCTLFYVMIDRSE